MTSVNDVNSSGNVNLGVDSTTLSQQDFISSVYLERGNMLDAEVRRLAGDIENANRLLDAVGTMTNKANIAQYGDSNYSDTTWSVNGNNIVLDNGYGIAVVPGEDGGTTFAIVDAEGNQLSYQNQTLLPIAKDAIASPAASSVGIPVMNDMTLVLDDGTEISFATSDPSTPYNPSDLSGGLADITSITITRGNQGMTVTGLDTADPVIRAPALDGESLDSADNDGYVLLESGGLHAWEYDGESTDKMTATDPEDSDATIAGFDARKTVFNESYSNEVHGGAPVLTQQEIDILTNELKISYSDASGKGQLTPDEWTSLKSALENAKSNLTGSSQLQTVELQRAITVHNQNFEAMSNAQNRIYSLLRDMINNMK